MKTLDCGHTPNPSEHTPGYGTDSNGKTFCYMCCAEQDKADMLATGRAMLYLVQKEIMVDTAFPASMPTSRKVWFVTNWPGSLNLRVYGSPSKGRHNIARVRYDFNFLPSWDNFWWHGVQYGDNTQIAHCRRTKERRNGAWLADTGIS